MNQWLKEVLYGVIPGTCILCESGTRRNLDLCRACEKDLPWSSGQCYLCALPLGSTDTVCGPCILSPPLWSHCFTAFEYTSPLDHLIGEFKNNHKLLVGKVLASLLASAYAFYHHADEFPDLLLPVPLHKTKRRSRGYNQAAEIADVLADHCDIPVDHRLCRKVHETPQQKFLDAYTRKQNIKHAYQLHREISGVRVGLVDDVVTTGATATELTRILLKGGAASVDIIALARTLPPGQGPVERRAVW